MKNRKKDVWFILSCIVLVGIFLRFYHINITPPGIYPDEAVNGQDALKLLDNWSNFKWFYPDNDGREGLFINLVALSFAIFGVSAFSLKLPAIFFGCLSILGIFFLTKELFKSDKLALMAAFLNAFSFVAINFSRISFRANMLPFVLVWSFYFLFKGINSKQNKYFIWAGIFFGVGAHSYIAFRLAPFILVGALPFLILARKNFLKDFRKSILFFVGTSFLVALPMFFTFYMHPEYFWSRPSHVSVFSPEISQGHPWSLLVDNIKLSLLKYNFIPDINWRNNYPPFPILNPVLGVLFLFGAALSLFFLVRSLWLRVFNKIYSDDLIVHSFLFIWFFVMLAPEFMTAEGIPHTLRSIGNLSVVYIWASFFIFILLKKVDENIIWGKKLIYIFFVFIFLFVGIFDGVKYHYFWANHIQTARSFEKNITDLAYYIKAVSKEKEVYAILGNMQRVVGRIFNWGNSNFKDLSPYDIEKINIDNKKEVIFVFSDYKKDEIIESLSKQFGNMQLETITDKYGLKYYILEAK